MKFSLKPMLLAWLLLSLPALASAEERATLLRDSALRAKPYLDAAVVDDLEADTQLTVISKKGIWVQVRTLGGQEGWLKSLGLKFASPTSNNGGSRPGRLSILKTGSSGVTATTGVKGLNEGLETNPAPNSEANDGKAAPPAKQEPANQVLDLLKGLKSLGGD